MMTGIKTKYRDLNIELKELVDFNYFVGKNGSGKTRLFDAISEYMYCKKKGVSSDSTTINFDTHCTIAHNQSELNNFMVKDRQYHQISNSNDPNNQKRMALGCADDFKENKTTKKILQIFGMEKLHFELGCRHDEREPQNNCINFYKDASKETYLFWLDECSSGFQSLFKIWNNIFHNKISIENKISYLLTIDEGDRHLHPTLAKSLPENLEHIKIGIEEQLKKNGDLNKNISVQFFISTHSPFLISGLKNVELKKKHKIYILEEGETVELRGNKNTSESQKGYASEQALLAVNKMLGAGVSDLTPQIFVLAEESVHVLLDAYAQKIGREINHFRFTTSGDGETIKKALQLLGQRKIIPFFDFRIIVIFDGKLDSVSPGNLQDLQKNLGADFMYVRDEKAVDMESCFCKNKVDEFIKNKNWGMWDRGIIHNVTFTSFLNGEEIKKSEERGKIKSELAKYVVENLDSEALRNSLPVLDKIFLPSANLSAIKSRTP